MRNGAFSHSRDGPLDMRMDRTRGRPASQILITISEEELARALHDLGDEPEAERGATHILQARQQTPLEPALKIGSPLIEGQGNGLGVCIRRRGSGTCIRRSADVSGRCVSS